MWSQNYQWLSELRRFNRIARFTIQSPLNDLPELGIYCCNEAPDDLWLENR